MSRPSFVLLLAASCLPQTAAVRVQRAPSPDLSQAVAFGRLAEKALADGPLRKMGPLVLSSSSLASKLPGAKGSEAWGDDKLKGMAVVGTLNDGFSAGAFGTGGTDGTKSHALYGVGYKGLQGAGGAPGAYGIVGAAKVDPSSFEAVHAMPSPSGGADYVQTRVRISRDHVPRERLPSWVQAVMGKAVQPAPERAAPEDAEGAARRRAAAGEAERAEGGARAEAERREAARRSTEQRKAEDPSGLRPLEVGRAMKVVTETQTPVAASEAPARQASQGGSKKGDFLSRIAEAVSRPPTLEQLERKEFLRKLGERLQPTPEQLEQGKELLKKLQPTPERLRERAGRLLERLRERAAAPGAGAAAPGVEGASAGQEWLRQLQGALAGLRPGGQR